MKHMKKWLALLLTGMMLVGMVGCGSEDEDSEEDGDKAADKVIGSNDGNGIDNENGVSQKTVSEGLKFKLGKDGTYYEVAGIGTCTDTKVIIPATYNEKPVTAIGMGAFSECTSITSVVIPEGVTRIYMSAFFECSALESVTIPDSVISIASTAFAHCTALTDITIPGGVESIGLQAFYLCESLASIEIPNSVTRIDRSAFQDCDALTSIVIPESVEKMGMDVFSYCDLLTDVYCEADSEPEKWDNSWLYGCSATVHWGYKG